MRNLLLSTVTLVAVPVASFASSNFFADNLTTPIELKSISQLNKAYKTAGVCFLTDSDCHPVGGFSFSSNSDGTNETFDLDTIAQCLNEGFSKLNCNSVQEAEGVCPYNSAYGRGCKCSPGLISCSAGQVGVGESCDGKYASCKCGPNLKACSSKEVGQGASCGGKYESCVCKSEYQYTSSNCSYPRSTSGDECSGKYTNCVCPTGVDEGLYGCEEYYPAPCNSVCKIAYPDNCHKRTDNNSSVYGCMKYWDDCKSKCETPYKDNCRNHTAVTCQYGCASYFADCQSKCEKCKSNPCDNRTAVSIPANARCTSYYSDCSSKCSAWACNDGYKQSGSGCINPCDNRTAVISSCPANATCQYYSDCSSKISSWSCNSGYVKSGSSCIVETCENKFGSYALNGQCPSGTVQSDYVTGTLSDGRICYVCMDKPCSSGYSKYINSCNSPYRLCTDPNNSKCHVCRFNC